MVDYKDAALVGAGSVVPEHHLPETSMAMRSRKTTNRFDTEGKSGMAKLTDMYPEPEHPTDLQWRRFEISAMVVMRVRQIVTLKITLRSLVLNKFAWA